MCFPRSFCMDATDIYTDLTSKVATHRSDTSCSFMCVRSLDFGLSYRYFLADSGDFFSHHLLRNLTKMGGNFFFLLTHTMES